MIFTVPGYSSNLIKLYHHSNYTFLCIYTINPSMPTESELVWSPEMAIEMIRLVVKAFFWSQKYAYSIESPDCLFIHI